MIATTSFANYYRPAVLARVVEWTDLCLHAQICCMYPWHLSPFYLCMTLPCSVWHFPVEMELWSITKNKGLNICWKKMFGKQKQRIILSRTESVHLWWTAWSGCITSVSNTTTSLYSLNKRKCLLEWNATILNSAICQPLLAICKQLSQSHWEHMGSVV